MATIRAAGVNAGMGVRLGAARPRTARVVVRVENENQTRSLDLSMNDNSVTGYVEKDTAGQSNMYPVVTKPFEAGSSSDTSNNGVNLLAAGAAGAAALGAIVVGLSAVTSTSSAVEPSGEFRSLSQYAELFAAEN